MATPQSKVNEEPLDDLVSRVKTMLPEVDLERDLTEQMAGSVAIAEMSGTPVAETTKKLFVLMKHGRITHDEYTRIALEDAIP